MLNIEHLYFSYTGQPPYVLQDISLNVKKGDYISITGANGCGKSTLMRVILGFLTPTKGKVEISTKNIRYVAQKQVFSQQGFPVTVGEILNSYRKLLNIKDPGEVQHVLKLTGMEGFENQLMGNLSGGQAQKIAIARTLIGKPELIILDEPSTGIDVKSQQEIYKLLKKINKKYQVSIISVEHNLDAAIANSTHIYHLVNGHGHTCSPRKYAQEIINRAEKKENEEKEDAKQNV